MPQKGALDLPCNPLNSYDEHLFPLILLPKIPFPNSLLGLTMGSHPPGSPPGLPPLSTSLPLNRAPLLCHEHHRYSTQMVWSINWVCLISQHLQDRNWFQCISPEFSMVPGPKMSSTNSTNIYKHEKQQPRQNRVCCQEAIPVSSNFFLLGKIGVYCFHLVKSN